MQNRAGLVRVLYERLDRLKAPLPRGPSELHQATMGLGYTALVYVSSDAMALSCGSAVLCGSRRVSPSVIVCGFSKLLFLCEPPDVLVDAS